MSNQILAGQSFKKDIASQDLNERERERERIDYIIDDADEEIIISYKLANKLIKIYVLFTCISFTGVTYKRF